MNMNLEETFSLEGFLKAMEESEENLRSGVEALVKVARYSYYNRVLDEITSRTKTDLTMRDVNALEDRKEIQKRLFRAADDAAYWLCTLNANARDRFIGIKLTKHGKHFDICEASELCEELDAQMSVKCGISVEAIDWRKAVPKP